MADKLEVLTNLDPPSSAESSERFVEFGISVFKRIKDCYLVHQQCLTRESKKSIHMAVAAV